MKRDMNHAACGRERLDHLVDRDCAERRRTPGSRSAKRSPARGKSRGRRKTSGPKRGKRQRASRAGSSPEHLLAEIGQSIVARRVSSRSRPSRSPHCASASCNARRALKFAQDRKIVVDRVPALNSQEHGNFVFRVRRPDLSRIVAASAKSSAWSRICFATASSKSNARRVAAASRNFNGHPEREKDRANASFAQPGNIDAAFGIAAP